MCRILTLVGVENITESISPSIIKISTVSTPIFSRANENVSLPRGEISDFVTPSHGGKEKEAEEKEEERNTGCLKIHATHVTANNSANINVLVLIFQI